MPNPRTKWGTCHNCNANGGAPERMRWAVICLRPADSSKTISRMPEAGCCYWQPPPKEGTQESAPDGVHSNEGPPLGV